MFTLSEVEGLFRALAHVHRHPDPESYAREVATAWHELSAEPSAPAEPAPAPAESA